MPVLLLLTRLQERVKTRERVGDGRRLMAAGGRAATVMPRQPELLVLVIVAIQAQQFPVTPIKGIIAMIMVFVVNRELPQSAPRELAATPCANVGKQLQRPLSITRFPQLQIATKFSFEPCLRCRIRRFLWFHRHFRFRSLY